MHKTLGENGEWRAGKATPKLLPEQLRELPGELLANDIDDPDRAHELDAPHVVGSLVTDHEKSKKPKPETHKDALPKLWFPKIGERAPVRQWFVDVVKFRIIQQLVNRAVDEFARGVDVDMERLFHVWFPENNVNHYELRKGLPPERKKLPAHLKNIDLVIDVLEPPKSVLVELYNRGVRVPDPRTIMEDARRDGQIVIV